MDQKRIGVFIAESRKVKGLTQMELGERLGVSNKTVSRWEMGNYMPDLSMIEPLCRELDISVNEFFCGERLKDEDYREQADSNLVSILTRESKILRIKRLGEFFGGGGVGVLLSALALSLSPKRTVTVIVAVIMILIGWYLRGRLDRQLIGERHSSAPFGDSVVQFFATRKFIKSQVAAIMGYLAVIVLCTVFYVKLCITFMTLPQILLISIMFLIMIVCIIRIILYNERS